MLKKDKIPRNTPYCYHWDPKTLTRIPCPFLTYKPRKTRHAWRIECADVSGHWEYCKYLKKYLNIQDLCKDCDFGHWGDE
jgi:hypothetical protein